MCVSMTSQGTLLFDSGAVGTMLSQMADAIVADFPSGDIGNAVLIGIQTNGVPLARWLAREIESRRGGAEPSVGTLDISMYRDDIGKRLVLGRIHETDISFDIDDVPVILIDDVLRTGRTIRAALDAITDYGRPSMIKLAVLIDRGGHEFPIRADYIGSSVDVEGGGFVSVEWSGSGEDATVVLATS